MSLIDLTDDELIALLEDSIAEEREKLVGQLRILFEMDSRKCFRQYSSLTHFLKGEYRMKMSSAYRRVRVARMMIRLPRLAHWIEAGRLNLSVLGLADAYFRTKKLTPDEEWAVLESLEHKSCEAAERELRRLDPKRIPHEKIRPLTEELSEVRIVLNEEMLGRLEQVKGLLAHSHPGITFAELIDHLAQDFLKRNHPEEKAKRSEERQAKKEALKEERIAQKDFSSKPKRVKESESLTRRVSNSLAGLVVKRDGYRCAYVDPDTKKRCESTHGLQIDHKTPWASGGKTELENLRYLCRAHNIRAAILHFGIEKMRGFHRI